MGISKHDFFHMTPKDFDYAVDAYNEKMKERQKIEELHYNQIDYQAWLTGLYVRIAVGNVLGGKKAQQYPQKPMSDKSDSMANIAERNGMTEAELNEQLIYATMMVREANARIDAQDGGRLMRDNL